MKKGFTLIELLVIIAIIGILSSIVLTSLHAAKCKKNPRMEGCKSEQSDTASSTVKDKFNREDPKPTETTVVDSCDQITNLEGRKACQDEEYKSKMIQECITKYTD